MAFEDRSSPNSATSPNSDSSQTPLNAPNSPESTRTSPYTCMTIAQDSTRGYVSSPTSPNYVVPKVEPERSFIRITSFALSSPKREVDVQSPQDYSNFRSPSPAESISSRASPPINPEPTIQTLKYSITNILKPEFGKNAVQKTKTSPRINFKPYETKSCEDEKPFPVAPLGSLCQTVSQIGSRVKSPEPIPRVKSPVKSLLPNPEEIKKTDGNVPQLWPAWVYCTRYSDRPSSGK